MGQRLASLVQAGNDPILMATTMANLGGKLPPVPTVDQARGFGKRVQSLRRQLFSSWINRGNSLQLLQQLQQQAVLQNMQKMTEQELRLRRMEEVALDAGEQRLATQLFQRSSLSLFVRRLPDESPETLRKQLKTKAPLLQLFVVSAIGQRHVHLEDDLLALVNDSHPAIREVAHKSLVRVARGTDFGPIPGASQTGITRSVEKWRHWLALQHGDSPQTTTVAETATEDKIDPAKAVKVVLGQSNRELQTVSSEATDLCDELVKAKGDEQMSVLARLRDSKGIDNTDALALAIPKLSLGAAQREARDALAQRLTRMTAATLRDKLQEDAIEVRRAAALACGRKNATEHVPDLLQLLDDPEVAVIQAARTALKELTGEDFGPDAEAGRRGRASAAAAWRKWWKEHPSEQE